jgi:hypothetical protein
MPDLTLITSATVTGGSTASVTFNAIPQTYKHLMFIFKTRSNRTGGSNDRMFFNTLSSNYDNRTNFGFFNLDASNGSNFTSNSQTNSSGFYFNDTPTEGTTAGTASAFNTRVLWIANYSSTSTQKSYFYEGGFHNDVANSGYRSGWAIQTGGLFKDTAAISSITMETGEGGVFYSSGAKVWLYGLP